MNDPALRVEPMRPADVARCAELEKVLFPGDDPWPEVAFLAELAGRHNRYVVVRDESGRALGYAGIALLGTSDDPEAEVHTIGVDPGAQRGGIGTALLRALLAAAAERGGPVYLEVRTDNDSAIALYDRHGFRTVGVRKNYYQPSGADAFTMCRPAAADVSRRDVPRGPEVLS